MIDEIRTIRELKDEELRGKVVLVRAEFNVPVTSGQIDNDFRIRRVLPTLAYLSGKGARVVVLSHIWGDETTSLRVVHEYLARHMEVAFIEDILSDAARDTISELGEGSVALAENLRLYPEEQANDRDFAERIAELGDIYINEAFAVSHREHASVVGIPEFLPAYAGFQLIEEIESLSRAFEPEHPFVFILGGAKFKTKIPLISKFLPETDEIHVTGALANVYLEARGYEVGHSLMPKESIEIGTAAEDERIIIPTDVVSLVNGEGVTKSVEELNGEDNMQDIGPASLARIEESISHAALIVWNGPVGNYETGYGETTREVARMIAESDATSIVGGGDTLAALVGLEIEEKISFASTGGGAMLEFLLNETLPGIEVLRK